MDYSAYAELYDAEYADYIDDVPFYVEWAQKSRPPVLELGCGTGRVLVPVAEAGVPVWGLDSSEEMLAVARRKLAQRGRAVEQRARLVQHDMARFSLDQKFGLIYLPFREFMHLMKVEQQLSCLTSIRQHLALGGRVLINVYDVDVVALVHARHGSDPLLYRQPSGDYNDPHTGHRVLLSAASRFDPLQQALLEERFYERVDEQGRVVERRVLKLSQRWFFRWEMVHLLARAGFTVEQLLGGYFGERYAGLGQEMIFVARVSRKAGAG